MHIWKNGEIVGIFFIFYCSEFPGVPELASDSDESCSIAGELSWLLHNSRCLTLRIYVAVGDGTDPEEAMLSLLRREGTIQDHESKAFN